MIAEARASAAAGGLVSSEEVDAWSDSLDTDHELPAPAPGGETLSRPERAEKAQRRGRSD
jgi:hypothetical protein